MERRPIVIVGAGPAGAATALALHRDDPALARDVVIVEKARHPRPKVCAGGLIPAGRRWLAEHDVAFSVPHVTVDRALVTTPATTVAHDDHNLCDVVRRAEFDAALVAACRERGIAVQEAEDVLDARREGDGVRLITTRGAYDARLVIGADGSGSLVRRRLVGGAKARLARAVMTDVPLRAARWAGFAARRYEFDFSVCGADCAAICGPSCLIDGEPHANIGAYSLTPSARRWTERSPTTCARSPMRRRAAAPSPFTGIGRVPAWPRRMPGWWAMRPVSTR
jgi:2-polyprenyl-6-methoxyphenol hydroxylase-like FAD-dependent oxidoreductase